MPRMSYAEMEMAAKIAAAERAHRKALAEGRPCACEGPHRSDCMIDGRRPFEGLDA